MDLDLFKHIVKDAKKNSFVENFTKELQNHLEMNVRDRNIDKEDRILFNSIDNGYKITAKYRDKMLLERSNILINYAKQTLDKGEMYYIYSRHSNRENCFNLCICEEGKSHIILEEDRNDLPSGATIGSVLRKNGDSYILDEQATKEIEKEIDNMQLELLEEQNQFLESKRIEQHIYEMSEKEEDRAFLFDITSNSNEEIEEIDFPIELLKDSKEGDLFIYQNGEYKKKK